VPVAVDTTPPFEPPLVPVAVDTTPPFEPPLIPVALDTTLPFEPPPSVPVTLDPTPLLEE
jgi:hypothetical protein